MTTQALTAGVVSNTANKLDLKTYVVKVGI